MDLANWALRTVPKFTARAKYQFHQGFWPNQRSGNPNHPSATTETNPNLMEIFIETYTASVQLLFIIFTYGIVTFVNTAASRSLSPGIGTTVTLISASLPFWKRWPNRNFLRRNKRQKSLGVSSGLHGGRWLNTSQPNSRRCVDRRAVCGHRPSTADDEFRSPLCSLHSKTLS